MKTPTFLTLSMLCLTTTGVWAQTQQWTAKFNGKASGNDAATAMVTDASGNVYVTGYANNGATGDDYVTIKYNSSGIRQWVTTYDGPGSGQDVPNSICIDQSGNVYVTGKSDALTGTFVDLDAATIKYSPDGRQLWVARYDGGVGRADAGRVVRVDANGNVFITGYTSERSGANSDANYLTVKYNSSGVRQWVAKYAGTAQAPNDKTDSANAIDFDAAGNIYVTGVSSGNDNSPVGLNQDYLTIKYSPSGVQQWIARYNGPSNRIDDAFALVTNAEGDVYVTGLSTGAGFNDYDMVTVKYNTSGVQQWVQRHNGPASGPDFGFAIAMDPAGNIIVTGTDEAIINNEDIFTVKYDPSGTQLWSARYDGGDNDDPEALTVDAQGNVYVTGYSTNPQTFIDMATIKYNSSGVQQWIQKFTGQNGFDWDISYAVSTDASGNVYIAGYTTDRNTGTDFRVIKYSNTADLTSDKTLPAANGSYCSFLQNAPNPFAGSTKISFLVNAPQNSGTSVRLLVENSIGEQMAVLLDKELENGTYQIDWNAQQLPGGIYYCKLICNNSIQMTKMLLVK